MYANWFTSPQTYEAVLGPTLHRAVQRDLVRSAIKALLLQRHLSEGAADVLITAGVSTGELAEGFDALVRALPIEPLPLSVMARAMAYVTRTFPDVDQLRASQTLDRSVGLVLVRVLTETLFPLSGQTPDPDADARWAATELIAFRQLQPATLDALGAPQRAVLAERLEDGLGLMLALVPAAHVSALCDVIDKAALGLRRQPPIDVAELNAAIAL